MLESLDHHQPVKHNLADVHVLTSSSLNLHSCVLLDVCSPLHHTHCHIDYAFDPICKSIKLLLDCNKLSVLQMTTILGFRVNHGTQPLRHVPDTPLDFLFDLLFGLVQGMNGHDIFFRHLFDDLVDDLRDVGISIQNLLEDFVDDVAKDGRPSHMSIIPIVSLQHGVSHTVRGTHDRGDWD